MIFGGVTLIAIASWWFTPSDHWLRHEHIREIWETIEQSPEVNEAVTSR